MRNGPYELIVAPVDYPGRRYRGRYCYEHHLVFWRAYGKLPGRGEVIHHRNENKRDNRPENLELKAVGDHNREHNVLPRVPLTCTSCRNVFERLTESQVAWKLDMGQRDFYCNRRCAGRHYGRGRRKRSGVAQEEAAPSC